MHSRYLKVGGHHTYDSIATVERHYRFYANLPLSLQVESEYIVIETIVSMFSFV